MELDMKTKKKICARIFSRYPKARKKDKPMILLAYAQTPGYNRDYLALPLRNWGKTRYSFSGEKSLKFLAKPPSKAHKKATGGKETGRPQIYHKAFVQTPATIWEFFEFPCGKLLAPLIRGIVDFLVADFKLSEDMRCLLLAVSPATIERKLKRLKSR